MSLRTLIQPRVTELITSPRTRERRRRVAERLRFARGRPHLVRYFHQVDDPYSHLAAQFLEPLLDRYDIELEVHLVGPPADSAAPERERLVAYSRLDAARLAEARGLHFRDPGTQPSDEIVACATHLLATVSSSPRAFAALAPRVGEALWDGDRATLQALERDQRVDTTRSVPPALSRDATLARGDALRKKLGHYLGAVFHYGGETYWGVDRLGYLEARLVGLGVLRKPASSLLAPRLDVSDKPFRSPAGDLGSPTSGVVSPASSLASSPPGLALPAADLTLECFVSLRSPYSYISMPRTYELAARSGVALKIRPVLPMVMRGLAVPAAKRMYITLDTKREAESVGLPFGKICDPVGRPVERGFSLYPYAKSKGREAEYLLSFCRAAFAEGVDTGSDEGLRHVALAAGLDWEEACRNFDEGGWRAELEANREEMLSLGLWGVPSYRLRGGGGEDSGADLCADFCTWGQDRLWMVEEEIRRRCATR